MHLGACLSSSIFPDLRIITIVLLFNRPHYSYAQGVATSPFEPEGFRLTPLGREFRTVPILPPETVAQCGCQGGGRMIARHHLQSIGVLAIAAFPQYALPLPLPPSLSLLCLSTILFSSQNCTNAVWKG